jgi:hypothetical protein
LRSPFDNGREKAVAVLSVDAPNPPVFTCGRITTNPSTKPPVAFRSLNNCTISLHIILVDVCGWRFFKIEVELLASFITTFHRIETG